MFLIEKKLVNFFRVRDQQHPFSISNSLQLVERLRDISFTDNEYMTVLDYKSLYPLIKLPSCFCALRDFLFTNTENAPRYHAHILELAHLICYTSFFEFEGNVFLQGRGVLMGSPTSAILCKLVLRQLENTVLCNIQQHIILYARYVEDIFILWKREPNLQHFLDTINDNPYSLLLQVDQRSDTNVNFLDISIKCKQGEICTDIYRKPHFQPIVIPHQSINPRHIKLASFRAWIKCAYTHCTSIYDTTKELDYILKIAE
ncbi:uncharacterized protein [Centruroides vittatus]|uniref:uncharacterized protein n=1 Tax=Centruroides vittatus TaxID=120091 RepID=UPI00350F152B